MKSKVGVGALCKRVLLIFALVVLPCANCVSGQQPAAPLETVTPPPTSQQVARMQAKLSDWPQLGRYRAEDSSIGPPKPGEERVIFLGDSITDFWGRRYGRFFPGKPYINRGISGQTTPQMVVRFQQDVIALRPAAVVILAGINDIAGNTGPESTADIEDNFRSMVTLAQAAHIRVVLCSVLPAAYFPWKKGVDPRPRITELNTWLRQYASDMHAVYLDYYPALVDSSGGMRPELAFDQAVHPNDAGYALMEPLAEKAIAAALAQLSSQSAALRSRQTR